MSTYQDRLMTKLSGTTWTPATDTLIDQLTEMVQEQQSHDHPAEGTGPDLFCLNHTSYMGGKMGPVLARLRATEAAFQEKATAIVEICAGAERLLKRAEAAEAEAEQLRRELAAVRAENWIVPKIAHDANRSVRPILLPGGWIHRDAGDSDADHTRQYAAQLLAAADHVEAQTTATAAIQ